MRNLFVTFLFFITGFFLSFDLIAVGNSGNQSLSGQGENEIIGEWLRMTFNGPVRINFKANGEVEYDFGNNKKIEVTSNYQIKKDTIIFIDKEGDTCPEKGVYKMDVSEYYLAFSPVDDQCGGRIKKVAAFWVKPDHKKSMQKLSERISKTNSTEAHLNRARMYMAMNKPSEAKPDFDYYINHEDASPRIYVNRASTRFPDDLEGVVEDCNKAIELDPENMNAYFLKGLALNGLGEKKKACENFKMAIESGFTILKDAERNRCAEYWDDEFLKEK
jgi:tetratricopeptide (TPR) repeat protein